MEAAANWFQIVGAVGVVAACIVLRFFPRLWARKSILIATLIGIVGLIAVLWISRGL